MSQEKNIETMTEQELREYKVPWFETQEEALAFIGKLVNRQHDYGTCVYAMSLAAQAAFNHVAHKLGVTGFQASCADMSFIRATRSIKGPFRLVDYANMLYPQYEHSFARTISAETAEWLKTEATEKLAKDDSTGALSHVEVRAHWARLAKGELPFGYTVERRNGN